MTRRLLVFGSTGQVGRELARAAWPAGMAATFLDRRAADFARPEALSGIVSRQKPDAIIIAAAYTAVDAAESDEETATMVNAVAPGSIARSAAALSVPTVYISTDYVFDGEKGGRYVEQDAVNPINAYGRSKLAGEIAVRAANPRHLILRTSWLYSAHGTNFLRSMLKLAATRKEATIVADQYGCPTAAADLAQAIARIAPLLFDADTRWGTYHLAGESETTWHGFAEAIFAELAKRGLRRPINRAISTAEFPRPARRPANSRLSSAAFRRAFGIRLPGFEAAVPRVLDEALAEEAQEEGAVHA
ncbi:MAG: dTDP-4-dehydrorhamnose reductase [Propylenella sp.]